MLVILVAHHAEAAVFLEHYDLKLDQNSSGNCRYVSGQVRLLITGEGKENVQYILEKELAICETETEMIWLNFGVAGSSQHAVSDIVEVTKLAPGSSSDSFKALNLRQKDLSLATSCRSFLVPQETYPERGVIDMEAYYIAKTLQSAGLLENMSVIKLVVDGPSNPMAELSVNQLKSRINHARRNLTEISDKLIF